MVTGMKGIQRMRQSLETTSEHLGVLLDEIVRVSLVHDATTLLLFGRSRQLKVCSANVPDHIATLFGSISAVIPGTLKGLQGQVDALVIG